MRAVNRTKLASEGSNFAIDAIANCQLKSLNNWFHEQVCWNWGSSPGNGHAPKLRPGQCNNTHSRRWVQHLHTWKLPHAKNMSHVFEKIIWYDMIWLNIIWYNYIDILMIWDFDSKELPALGFLTASWMQRVGSWDLNMGAGPRRLELTMLCKYQLPAEPRFKLLNSWKRQSVKSSALKLAHICWR